MRRKDILVKYADVKFYLHGEVSLDAAQDVFSVDQVSIRKILEQAGYYFEAGVMKRKGRGRQRRSI